MKILILLAFLLTTAGCTDVSGSSSQESKEITNSELLYTPYIPSESEDVSKLILKIDPPSRFDPSALSAAWVEPEIIGEKISIPKGPVEEYRIVNFELFYNNYRAPMMAVKTTEGGINIMPRICVPCRSEGWHLKNDVLICDTCGTTFDAKTGGGIAGGCKDFPKAFVPYTESSGKLVMDIQDIAVAYQKTLQPGWP